MLLGKGFYGNHRLNNSVAYNKPCPGDSGYMDGRSTVYVLENPVKYLCYWERGFYGNHRLNNTVVYNKPCTGDSEYRDGWSKIYVLENSVKYLCYWERGFMVITD